MKRLLILIICFISICVLASCEENNEKPKLNKGSIFNSNSSAATVLTIYVEKLPVNSEDVMNEVALQTKKQLNIDLKLKELNSSNLDNTVRLLKSTDWDLIVYGGHPSYYYNQGCLMDVTDLFPQKAPVYYSRFNKDDLQNFAGGESLYAIPPLVQISSRLCAIVRRDFLVESGLDGICTLEELEKYMQLVKGKHPQTAALSANSVDIDMLLHKYGYVSYSNGLVYKWDKDDIKLELLEKTEAFHEAVDIIERWQNSKYLYSDGINNGIELIRKGKVAGIITTINPYIKEALADSEYAFDMYILYPETKAPKMRIIDAYTWVGFNQASKKADKALEFIEWVHADQKNYDLLMYGIEGVNYSFNGSQISLNPKKPYNGYSVFTGLDDMDYFRTPASLNFDFKEFYKRASQENTKYPPHMNKRSAPADSDDVESYKEMSAKRRGILYSIKEAIRNGQFSADAARSLFAMQDTEKLDKYLMNSQLR